MDNSGDLRKILSQNIKSIRSKLHISQAKLAEHANISLSYLTDIERCRTWVSDKTLLSLARALNIEVWELLLPNDEDNKKAAKRNLPQNQREKTKRITDLIIKKREVINHAANQALEDLIMEIIREK